jgi:hypothetical protein
VQIACAASSLIAALAQPLQAFGAGMIAVCRDIEAAYCWIELALGSCLMLIAASDRI